MTIERSMQWPDEEGVYWIIVCGLPAKCPVLARKDGDEMVVQSPLNNTWWMKRSEVEPLGDWCFSRLLEPNPFIVQSEQQHEAVSTS